MPFRRAFRSVAVAATLLLALAAGRAPTVPLAAEEPGCPERGSCPRCPESGRRTPACASCPQSTEAVTSRRVRLARPACIGESRPARENLASPPTLVRRHGALRHAVFGASPPTHLLLATLRS